RSPPLDAHREGHQERNAAASGARPGNTCAAGRPSRAGSRAGCGNRLRPVRGRLRVLAFARRIEAGQASLDPAALPPTCCGAGPSQYPLPRTAHYSATELVAAGVDVRTVAGRLGQSGGGTTTLRVLRTGSWQLTSAPPRQWPASFRGQS